MPLVATASRLPSKRYCIRAHIHQPFARQGILCLFQGENFIDDWLDLARLDQVSDLGQEAARQFPIQQNYAEGRAKAQLACQHPEIAAANYQLEAGPQTKRKTTQACTNVQRDGQRGKMRLRGANEVGANLNAEV